MFGSQILDAAIGLAFIYLLFSLIHTALTEYIASLFQLRAGNLRIALTQMLDDKNFEQNGSQQSDTSLVDQFLKHPLIYSISMPHFRLFGGTKRNTWNPSYLKPIEFSRVAISILRKKAGESDCTSVSTSNHIKSLVPKIRNLDSLKHAKELIIDLIAVEEKNDACQHHEKLKNIANDTSHKSVNDLANAINVFSQELDRRQLESAARVLKDTELGKVVMNSLNNVETSVESLTVDLENWFNRCMDQSSSWYKRKITVVNFVLAFVVAAVFNVNTISIAKELYRDPTLRKSIVAVAENADGKSLEQVEKLFGDNDAIHKIELPIGWNEWKFTFTPSADFTQICHNYFEFFDKDFFPSIPGILLSALAISLGASFWFDILNKLFRLRTELKPNVTNSSKPNELLHPVQNATSSSTLGTTAVLMPANPSTSN